MKNLSKKIVSIMFALALVVGNITSPQDADAKQLKLSKVNLTLQVGSTAKLTVKGVKGKLKWTSSKPKVAKVNKKGKITAKKVGKAVIKVKVKKQVFKCKVTVKKRTDQNCGLNSCAPFLFQRRVAEPRRRNLFLPCHPVLV
jgi:uncharacterized protein YjdB